MSSTHPAGRRLTPSPLRDGPAPWRRPSLRPSSRPARGTEPRTIDWRPGMTRPLILIGYLGKDPEIRQTRVRTYRGKRRNRVAECFDRYEFTTRPRDFIVVSLATHDDKGEATWHRLVAWNGDQLCHRNLRFAGK